MTFWWGRVKMRRPGYIWSLWGPCLDDVLMPFGRALPQKYADWSRTSGQVTLPSGRLLPRSPDVIRTVWPTELPPFRRQERPSGRFTLKNKKLNKNLQKLIFLRSVSERMYNPLITQSRSISKLGKDIKES
jgi:hypothetical protein